MAGTSGGILLCAFLTVNSGDGPVASDDGRVKRQLENERADVGISVRIHSCDVNRVHVGPFADLSVVRNERWSIIVHVYEKYLQCSCAAGRRGA